MVTFDVVRAQSEAQGIGTDGWDSVRKSLALLLDGSAVLLRRQVARPAARFQLPLQLLQIPESIDSQSVSHIFFSFQDFGAQFK